MGEPGGAMGLVVPPLGGIRWLGVGVEFCNFRLREAKGEGGLC